MNEAVLNDEALDESKEEKYEGVLFKLMNDQETMKGFPMMYVNLGNVKISVSRVEDFTRYVLEHYGYGSYILTTGKLMTFTHKHERDVIYEDELKSREKEKEQEKPQEG